MERPWQARSAVPTMRATAAGTWTARHVGKSEVLTACACLYATAMLYLSHRADGAKGAVMRQRSSIGNAAILLVVVTAVVMPGAGRGGGRRPLARRASPVARRSAAPSASGAMASVGQMVSSVSDGESAESLTEVLVGTDGEVSNEAVVGDGSAAGLFSGMGSIGIDVGVVLSTGDVHAVVGPNDNSGATTEFNSAGDSDLDELSGETTHDASTLEFDLVPTSRSISFRYVFASEEYREFVGSAFNDTFGLLVNGQNCATVPGTDPAVPVSVNTVNNGYDDAGGEPPTGGTGGEPSASAAGSPSTTVGTTQRATRPGRGRSNGARTLAEQGPTNDEYYRDNPQGSGSFDTQFDGLTTVLTCHAAVTPGVVNHLKLSIADASDQALDSAVFIQAGSLTSDQAEALTRRMQWGGRNPSLPCIACGIKGIFGDPVQASTGDFFHTWADLALPSRSGTLAITRTYDADRAAHGSAINLFGRGWATPFDARLDLSHMDDTTDPTITWIQENGSNVDLVPDGGGGWSPASALADMSFDVVDATHYRAQRRGGTEFGFTADGDVAWVSSMTDRNGYVTTIDHGPSSVVVTAYASPGDAGAEAGHLTFTLDGSGRAVEASDSIGRSIAYGYGSAGNLVSATALSGGSWAYGYDSSHRMTSFQDPAGGKIVNAYDAETGRVVAQWDQVATAAAAGTPTDPSTATSFAYDFSDPDTLTGTAVVRDPTGVVQRDEFTGGRLMRFTTAPGTADAATSQFAYDPATGMVTDSVGPDGNRFTTTYTADGWVKSSTDPMGNTTSYDGYDEFGNPGSVTDPDGVTTTYTYDGHGNTTSMSTPWDTHASAALTTYTYDLAHPGDLTAVAAPDGSVIGYEYDGTTGLVKSMTGPDGETTYGHDATGNQTWSVSPAGNAPGGTPSEHREAAVVNAAGETLESLDAKGQPVADGFVRANSSLGDTATGEPWSQLSGSWSVTDGVAAAVNGSGATALATVPTPGDTATGIAASMVVADPTANGPGLALRVDDANNFWRLWQLPAYGALVLSKNVNGADSTVGAYAASIHAGDRLMAITVGPFILVYLNGELLSTIAGPAAIADTDLESYATAGLVDASTGSVAAGFAVRSLAGGVIDRWFDRMGRITKSAGPRLGLSGEEVSSADYDKAGRRVRVTDGNQHSTVTEYDLAGRSTMQRVGVTESNPTGSSRTSYTYDDHGRIATVQASGKPAKTFTYTNGDETSPATQIVGEPSGAVVTTTLDPNGRPATVTYSDGTPTVSYSYDSDGRILIEDAAGSASDVVNTYDSLGQLTSVTRASRLVMYSYSAPGRISQIKYPFGNKIIRGYDDAGRWNSVTDWNDQTTTFGYDSDGNISTVAGPNGVTTTRGHDSDGAISHVSVDRGSTNVATWAYTRDQAGNLTKLTASGVGAGASWAYDTARQLTNQSAAPAESYGYDPAGNPTSVADTAQAFNSSGEICWSAPTSTAGSNRDCGSTPAGADSYAYNDNGQRTSEGGGSIYHWNAAGELTWSGRNVATSYLYDPSGLRTQAIYSGQYHRYTWDDTAGVPQLIGDQNPSHNLTFLYGPDGLPFEQIDTTTATTTWLHQDATGSVRCTTDGTGTITSTESWNPWGQLTDSTGTPPALGYKSKQTDPSGLIYLQARYYDPTTAQFLSVDPLAGITISRYGYVDNNPLNGSDPSGLIVYGQCATGSVSAILAVEGTVCFVTDGWHAGVLVLTGVGTGSPEAGLTGATLMSTAHSVSDMSGPQGCTRYQLGDGIGGSLESCVGQSGLDTSIFIGAGIEGQPAGAVTVSAMYAKYYSWSEIYQNIIKKVFGCGPGPPPSRYHQNPNGSWGSGGVSPNMDGNGLPLPPMG